ncbi:MAG: DUF2809 domain-containing protein [Chloroflexaceae bacterium]
MRHAPDGPRRDRLRLAAVALAVISLGLLTRADVPLPAIVASYGGDTLYATPVYLLIALVCPYWATWRIGLVAVGACYAVELSQLIQAPWLDALRRTLPGRLVLGASFLWSDLVCYTVGVLLGVGIDLVVRWSI